MPRALFTSKNLIGDTLYVQPALEEWWKEHPDWDVDLLTLNDHITCLYDGMVFPESRHPRVVFEPGAPEMLMGERYDFEHEFNVSKAFELGDKEKMHISTAYGRPLGYDIVPRRVKYQPSDRDDHEKGLILLSMSSNSCASRSGKPPNKMLSWAHWLPILTMVRQLGRVGVLGGPKDRARLPISEDEYFTGLPLEHVARLLRDAKLLITIDNGMGHLAATQQTPTILFYPACLGLHWIVPSGNERNLLVCQMDPIRISVAEASMVVRNGIQKLWKD